MRTHVEWSRSLDSRQLDKPIGREQLTAYVSDDDGMTWSGGFPVDTKTVHMDGRTFEGPQGLKNILLEDHDKLSRVFVEKLLSYALARRLTFRDREMLNVLYEQSADADYRLRDILLSIVSSEFYTRR